MTRVLPAQYHQYQVVGRHVPTEAQPEPEVFRMKLLGARFRQGAIEVLVRPDDSDEAHAREFGPGPVGRLRTKRPRAIANGH